ncbi:MAG: flagellin [Methanoregulaceae archaeon]
MTSIPHSQEQAFTGLEAALVFVAFIAVAAVFSYVVLGAGFFTAQKNQATIAAGVKQTTSSAQIFGDVYAITAMDNTSRWADYVKITLSSTGEEEGLDVSKMTVTYQDPETRWINLTYAGDPVTAADITGVPRWGILQKVNANTNTLLEPEEQFILGIGVPNSATAHTRIAINLLPPSGVGYSLQRTLPASVQPVMDLY